MSDMFDATNEKQPDYKRIEDGWYYALVKDTKKSITKSGVYHMITIEYKLKGNAITNSNEFKDRLMADRFCIEFANQDLAMDAEKANQTRSIGRIGFGDFLEKATGKRAIDLSDLDDLIGSKLMIKVMQNKTNPEYTNVKKTISMTDEIPEKEIELYQLKEKTKDIPKNHAPLQSDFADPGFVPSDEISF